MELQWFLIGVEGRHSSLRIQIKRDHPIVIGSDKNSDVVVGSSDAKVEATIWIKENTIFIEDTGVNKEVFLDGRRPTSSQELLPNMLIVICDQSFAIEFTQTEDALISHFRKDLWDLIKLPEHQRSIFRFPSIMLEAMSFTALSIFIVSQLGINEAGFFALFLASSSLVHRLEFLLNDNRERIFVEKEDPIQASLHTAFGILMMFLGICVAYLLTATSQSEQNLSSYFGFINDYVRIGNSTLFTRDFSNFQEIFSNNIMVMFSGAILCLFYRSYAALLTLGWNACVWVIVLVTLTRKSIQGDFIDIFATSMKVAISVLPHLVLESSAYILASLAAIFYSKGITKYSLRINLNKLNSKASFVAIKLPQDQILLGVTLTCLKMVGLALLLLFASATIESNYVPFMLKKISVVQ